MRWIGLIATVFLAGAMPVAPASDPHSGNPDAAEQAQTLDAPPNTQPTVWLGLFIEDALDGGVQIIDVVPGGPASQAGLKRGDVLVGGNGVDLANASDLRRATRKLHPGDSVGFTVLRGGSRMNALVVLAPSPPRGWALPKTPSLPPILGLGSDPSGIDLVEITSELRVHLGGPPGAGLLVTRVDPDGPCAGRVRAGDLIVKVGATPLDGVARWQDLLAARGQGALRLSGVRERKPYDVELSLVPAAPLPGERGARVRQIEAEIHELEARLDDLRRRLEALKSTQ